MTDPNERPSEAPEAESPSINEKETVRPVSVPRPADVQPTGPFSLTPPPVDVDSEPTPAYLVDDDLIDDDEPTYNGPARDSQAPNPSRPSLGVKSRFSTAPPKQPLAGRISSPNLGIAPVAPTQGPMVTEPTTASVGPRLGSSALSGAPRSASIVPPAPSLPPPSLPPPPARAPSLPPPKSRPGPSLTPGPSALPNLASVPPNLTSASPSPSVSPRSPSLPPPKSAPRTSAPPPKSVPLPLVSATSTAPRPTTVSRVPAPSVHPARSALIAKRLTPAAVSTPPVGRSAPPPSLSTGPASSQPPRDAAPVACPSAERLTETQQTETWLARAASLESHAGAQKDPVKKSRLLVVVSELYAMAGHLETARAIAERASKLGSHLAQRQARQLAQVADDAKATSAHFLLETNTAVTPETRRHSVLAHSAFERWTRKDPVAASRLLDQIPRVSPGDPLPRLLKLSSQLGHDVAAPMAAEGELPELTRAVHTLRRLRGESRPRSIAPQSDKPGIATTNGAAALDPVATFLEVRRALERRDRVAAATALVELQTQPGFERSAPWLAAALLAPTAITRKRSLELLVQLEQRRSTRAVRRALLARGLELGDNPAVQTALHADATREANEKAFSHADQLALGALSQIGDSEWLEQLANAKLDDDDRPLFAAAALRANRPDLAGALGDVPGPLVAASHSRLGDGASPKATVSPADVATTTADAAGALLLGLLQSAGSNGEGPSPDALANLPMLVDDSARGQLAFAAATLAETRGDLKHAQELFSEATTDAVCGEAALATLLRTREPNEASRLLSDFVSHQSDADRKAELLVQAALLTTDSERQVQLLSEAHTVAPDHVLVEAAVLRLVDKVATLSEGGDSLPPPSSPEAAAAPQAGLGSKRLAILSHQSVSGDNDYMRAMALLRHVFTKPSPTTRPTLLGHAWDLWPKDTALLDLRERYGSLPLDVRAKARESLASSVSGTRTGAALKTESALFYELAGMPSSAARVAHPNEQRPALLDGCFGRNAPGTEYAALWRQKILERAQSAEHSAQRSYYWLQVARLASDAGDWAAEREAVGRAIHLDPQNVEALLSAEALAFKDGEVERIAEVERYLAEALRTPDHLAHAQMASRFLHLSAGTSSGYTPLSACVDEGRTPGDVARKLAYQAPRMGDDELGYRMYGQLLSAATRTADKAALLVRSAELALKLGKAGTALTHLEDAIGLLPSWVSALSLRAEVLSDEGYHAAAAEAFERLAQAAQSKTLRAVAYRRAAEQLRQERPGIDESTSDAATGLLRVADPNRLRLNLERAFEAAPEDESVFDMLVDAYVALRLDGELGELFLARLKSASPDDHQRLTLRWSQACSQMGSSDRAFELVREVLQAQPESVGALEQLALLTKSAEERAHALLQLIRVSPTPAQQATAYQRLGDFYRDEGAQPQRAIKCYQEVLRRRPDAADTFRSLVDLQIGVGELTAAQASIDAFALKASTDHDRRMVAIARAAMTSVDNPAVGEKELQALLAERPFDTVVINELAQVYTRAKSTDQLQALTESVRQQAERELPLGAHVSQYLSSLAALAKQRSDNSALVLVSAVSNLYHGAPSGLDARGSRAVSRALDPQLAPAALSESLRSLLSRTSEALEEAFPLNIADLSPKPLDDARLTASFEMKAKAVGIAAPELFVVSAAPFLCVVTHHPSRVFLGLGWVERAPAGVQDFVVWRALKLLQARVGAVAHLSPEAAALRLDALLSAYTDPGHSLIGEANVPNRLRPLLHPLLPKDPALAVLASASVEDITSSELEIGDAIALWADRSAVLATGEPRVALLAICLRHGETNLNSPGALLDAVSRQPSARRLMASLLSAPFIDAHRSIH